jgi:hypothetical protein
VLLHRELTMVVLLRCSLCAWKGLEHEGYDGARFEEPMILFAVEKERWEEKKRVQCETSSSHLLLFKLPLLLFTRFCV